LDSTKWTHGHYDPARPCRSSGGFAARRRSWSVTSH
jgi:hypothetical protein